MEKGMAIEIHGSIINLNQVVAIEKVQAAVYGNGWELHFISAHNVRLVKSWSTEQNREEYYEEILRRYDNL